jgi:outer membrane protein assembly factor BamD
MSRRFLGLLLVLVFLLAVPYRSPAPLIYRPGEGWTYEPVGSEGKWQRPRAKEQLEVAQTAFDKKDYKLAQKAAKRVVRVWPLSDYAPQAQYLVARCYEERGQSEKAFAEYQKVLEKQPKSANFEDILQRQFKIANLYLAGKWFKLWGVIPIFSSMDKTAAMYEKIVRNGPYSDVAPQAQMNIGAAREKQKNYPMAAKAYELAADRYHDRMPIASDALYREGLAYKQQAQTAEYDQSTAGQAIATFTDFMALYPADSRVTDAQKTITSLKGEQARGSFETAKFYERYKRWRGALVYYNEVLLLDPNSQYANQARVRSDELNKRTIGTPQSSKPPKPTKPPEFLDLPQPSEPPKPSK